MKDGIAIPNHKFKQSQPPYLQICTVCGFVLGSGGGVMPECRESTQEEKELRAKEGLDILKKLVDTALWPYYHTCPYPL